MIDKNFNNNSSAFDDFFVKPKFIIISILVLFFLITSIVIFLVYPQYKNTERYLLSADKANAIAIAGSIAKQNNKVLEFLASYAQKQSLIDAAQKKDITEARGQLALLRKDSDFNLALMTDRRGILWANFPAFPVGADLSYRDWHKGASTDWKPHVSGVFQVMTGDKPIVVAYSVPFFDEERKPLGILTIYKKLDFIADPAKWTSLNQQTVVYVIDQAGNILFDTKSDFQKKITGYSLFTVVQKALTENKKQFEIKNQQTNQEVSYLSIAEVGTTGWLAIVQRNFQGNLSPQQAKSPAAIIVIFSLLFIILSVGLIYLRKIFIFKNKNEQPPLEIKIPEVENIAEATQNYPENRDGHKNIPLIVWDQDLIIVRFDHVFEEMTGWSKEEVLGKKVDILFPEKSKKESLGLIDKTVKSEMPAVLDVPILHSDGKAAMVHGQYIKDLQQMAQETSRLNGRLERRILERTGNLEGANRRLEAFSYTICHALLTPLRSIEELCDIAKNKYQEKADDTENNYLELILRETKRMGQLIDDMKKLSRLNKIEINRQSIDVSKIVQEIMEGYRLKFPDREVVVTIEKDILIDGDELLLKIALENIIDNAWKFTALKERATIKFGATLKDGTAALFIRDNGVGFDMAHINKLFGAFQHINTNTDFSGTGIGLATVQRIVERHGGEIWAESKPEKGATFYFTLSQ